MDKFEPRPVPEEDLVKLRRVSHLCVQQIESKIAIRTMTHAIINVLDDCQYFSSPGLSISATFIFFAFFFRIVFTSGFMPLEQLTNRLYERNKSIAYFS